MSAGRDEIEIQLDELTRHHCIIHRTAALKQGNWIRRRIGCEIVPCALYLVF